MGRCGQASVNYLQIIPIFAVGTLLRPIKHKMKHVMPMTTEHARKIKEREREREIWEGRVLVLVRFRFICICKRTSIRCLQAH